jgi:hypothetical protein
MPFTLLLPPPWPAQGWKAKIRDRERLEPPHLTILLGIKSWRFCLRTEWFLDVEPDPKEVPADLVSAIRDRLVELRQRWDSMYPDNPVHGGEDDNA